MPSEFRSIGVLAAALLSVAAVGARAVPAATEGARQIAGWIEEAQLPLQLVLEAKMDTGADTTSLDIIKMRRYRRDGKPWVSFWVDDPNDDNRRIRFERRVLRYSRIKRHSGERDSRPVVGIDICLGTVTRRVEVNLVDRSEFDYPLLVGRNFMAGEILVDPEAEHLLELDCAPDQVDDEGEREDR
ncbi:MAG: RimK/LysX family protein [Thermoanaerobaculia bacterium]